MTDSPQLPTTSATDGPLFGRAEALHMIGDDEDLLTEVAALAQTEIARQVAALKAALATADAALARREAHTLKGTVATLGAHAVRDAAMAAEHAAHDGDLASAKSHAAHLETLCARLIDELSAYRAAPRAA